MGNLIRAPYSEITATLEVFEKYGIGPEHFARFRADKEYAKRVTDSMISMLTKGITLKCKRCGSSMLVSLDQVGEYRDYLDTVETEGKPYLCADCCNSKNYTTPGRAKEIMGKNMLTLPRVEWHFDVRFTVAEDNQLRRIPWSEKVLQECKDTHVLFPGYPLTILDIRDKAPKGTFYSYENAWYNNQDFARKEKVNLRWYLFRKEVVNGSFSKIYPEQLTLLPENEEVPRVVEVVYMTILYYLVNNIRLFGDYYVRCQDLNSHSCRVSVGYFDRDGLDLGHCWSRDSYIGLAASRKI